MVLARTGARTTAGTSRVLPAGLALPVLMLALALVLSGCGEVRDPVTAGPARADGAPRASEPPGTGPLRSPTPSPDHGGPAPGGGAPSSTGATPPEPRRSFLGVPALRLRDLAVVRYRGRPDDAPGTRIQNRGVLASPRGPRGGVGPGEVGNLIVTGHRTSHGAPFAELPQLRRGQLVRVRSGDVVHVYRIVATRETSFRSARSRARQEAAVPGRPGVTPTRAMITLSTCATPEDHAEGNYWADRFGNPEHRIDKVGVLVRSRPVR